MKNKNKAIKIAAGSVAALGSIGGAAVGIVVATKKDETSKSASQKLDTARGGLPQTPQDAPADYTAYTATLDLTVSNVIEDAIPNFVEQLLDNALEILFTSRVIAIYNSISKGEITSAQLQDAIAKETFNKIYHLPLVVKIDEGQLKIPLGDLLLELLGKEEGSNPLLNVLKEGTSSIGGIVTAVSNAFDNSDSELGPIAFGKLLNSLTPVLSGGSQALLDSLKALLPKLDVSFDMSLTLTGLLDGLENKIVSNFDKIAEMQGKTFEEIAESEIYRNVAIHIFAMKHSAKISKEGLITSENLETMTTIYKVANGQEISKEEFIKLFSKSTLIDTMTPKGILSVQTTIPNTLRDEMMNSFKLEGKTPRELMGALIGSYVDVISLSIPELEFGRGAGQLGDNEKLLATKLAQLVADHTPDIFKLFGFNLADKPKLGGIAAILGLYFIPVVDSKYTPNGIQYSGQGLTSEQTNELVKKLYAQFGISIDWKEENFVNLVNVDNLEFFEFIAYIAFQDAEGLGATRLAFALNIVNELGLKLNI